MRTVRLTEETKKNILEDLLKRSPNQYKEYTEKVEAILKDVQENGDKAVFGYTEKFDKAVLTAETVRVGGGKRNVDRNGKTKIKSNV